MSRRSLLASVLTLGLIGTVLVRPADATAARRAVHGRVVLASGFYPRPYSYPPFLLSAGWGWYPFYPWAPFGPYPYPYPYWGYYSNASSVRVQAKPRDAEVYVDGYFVGLVDDFDGFAQRLDLRPGEHEIEIYRPGYRTYREKQLFRPRTSYKIQHALEPLPAGEAAPERPAPSASSPAPPTRSRRSGYDARPPRQASRDRARENPDFGRIAIRVQPPDAEVLIDDDVWRRPDPDQPLVVELSVGPHRVEVRKEGLTPYTQDVRIEPGETTELNVSLDSR